MQNQLSHLSKPKKFVIKRIGENDLVISREARDAMVKAMTAGLKFVQVDEYTLMVNSIKSIEPVPEPPKYITGEYSIFAKQLAEGKK